MSSPLSQDRRKETAVKDHFDASFITCLPPEGWLDSSEKQGSKGNVLLISLKPLSVWGPLFFSTRIKDQRKIRRQPPFMILTVCMEAAMRTTS